MALYVVVTAIIMAATLATATQAHASEQMLPDLNLTLTADTATTATLEWAASADGGYHSATSHTIQYKRTSTDIWNTFADGISADSSATLTGLDPSTSYDFRIAVMNSTGMVTYSDTATRSAIHDIRAAQAVVAPASNLVESMKAGTMGERTTASDHVSRHPNMPVAQADFIPYDFGMAVDNPVDADAAHTGTLQALAHESFDTKWKVMDHDKTINIYVTSAHGIYTIDWGDGTINTYSGPSQRSHTYDEAGTYLVRMSGDFTGIRQWLGTGIGIVSLEQWGTTKWSTMDYMFFTATNMVYNATDTPDISNVTSMSNMFNNAHKFNGDISSWDVSNVTNMERMLQATAFNHPLDSWDVSNVTDMFGIFVATKAFNQPLDSWDVSNVTNMSWMFNSAEAFNQPLDSWDVSHVTNMFGMFAGTNAFNQPLDSWDVSNVTNMIEVFFAANAFNQPLDSWDVSNVTNMYAMFSATNAFNQPLDSWDVSNVTNMNSMFWTANSFNRNIDRWDVSGVEDMRRMFSWAKAFNQPLDSWDVSGVASMKEMFNMARSFNQPIGSWNVSNVIDMSWMFNRASSFNQPIGSWNVSSVVNMSRMFDGSNFVQNLGKWYIAPDDMIVPSGQAEVATMAAQNTFLDQQDPKYGIAPGGDGRLFEMRGNTLWSASPEYQKRSYDITLTSTGVFAPSNSRNVTVTVSGEVGLPPPDPSVPGIRYAGITGPNLVTVRFSEPMTADPDAFADIMLSGENQPRRITAVDGSGNAEFTLVFGGAPAPPDATASMSITGSVTDSDGNMLVLQNPVAITDGQAPTLDNVSISSSSGSMDATTGDTVMLSFTASEAIAHVSVSINGKAADPANTDGNSWTASRKIGALDPAGTVGFSIGFRDLEVNAGDAATATTDGSSVSVARVNDMVSEGVKIISSDMSNAAGYAGDGVNVAVIDVGFDVTNAEITRSIADVRSFRADGDIGEGDPRHGTAVAEIITDVAPDARLFLYNLVTEVEFYNLVDHIMDRGDIDIVSMSLGWFNTMGPADGSSGIAKKVDEARGSGILWINSAGNHAMRHWQGQFHDPDGDGWHNFAGNDEAITVGGSGSSGNSVILSWDDWDTASQNFDLCLIKDGREEMCSSTSHLRSQPIELLEVDTANPEFAIKKVSASRDVTFQIYSTSRDISEHNVYASSLLIPADARGAMAVGAVYGDLDILESYSSQGPTLDGRTKPDITGPVRVSTTAYPFKFAGTSASAPHAAGAAALAMSKYPDATADQIQKLLESTVHSRHAKSNQDGTGRLDVRMLVDSDILALDADNRDCMSNKTCFFPDTLDISTGDTVRWVNAGNSTVTVTGSGSEIFDGRLDGRGDSYSRTFTSAGTFAYSSTTHPWASGRIMVSGNGTSGELADMIRDLRASISALTAKVTSLDASISSLTARVAALEGGGTPPPEPMTGIKGKVYQDTNGNGMLDAGEPGVPGRTVLTVNLADHSDVTRTITDSNGDYSVELAAGGYLVQIEGGGPQGYAYVTIPSNTMLVRNLIP